MLLYTDARFLEHRTGTHPEKPERLRRVTAHLEQEQLVDQCVQTKVAAAAVDELTRVHTEEYVKEVAAFAREHGGYIEADTVVSPRSYEVACLASGAVCDAVNRVVGGEAKQALCLVRPPGHHALAGAAMGFCLFNNVAVAAQQARQVLGLDRVMIIDWDVHHGNGTQDVFYRDAAIAFYSIHRHPFYPGTGRADETGAGDGLGTVVNDPMAYGISREDYLAQFRDSVERFADRFRPQLILVSAGFDSHRLDPVGSLGLEVEDFVDLTATVQEVARIHSEGRLVSVLEGGYNVDVLPLCVAAHLRQLLARDA